MGKKKFLISIFFFNKIIFYFIIYAKLKYILDIKLSLLYVSKFYLNK